jgi:hypothetical protein
MASTAITRTLFLYYYELFAQMHRMNGLWVDCIALSAYLFSSDNFSKHWYWGFPRKCVGGFCSGRIFPMLCLHETRLFKEPYH